MSGNGLGAPGNAQAGALLRLGAPLQPVPAFLAGHDCPLVGPAVHVNEAKC
jgi:hypothetical protein